MYNVRRRDRPYAVHAERVLGRGRRGPVRSVVRTVRVRARSGHEVYGATGGGGNWSSISQGREHSRKLGDVVQQQG